MSREKRNEKRAAIVSTRENKDYTKWLIITPFIFLVFGMIYPKEVPVNVWMITGLGLLPVILLAQTFSDSLRIHSSGYVDPLTHSSLRHDGKPWRMVSETTGRGERIDFAIFPMGGINVPPVFISEGGGRHGYRIVPKDNYITEGGSVSVHAVPVRYPFEDLPRVVRENLIEHPNFRMGNPVYMNWLPSDVSVLTSLSGMKEPSVIASKINQIEMHARLSDRENNALITSIKKERRNNTDALISMSPRRIKKISQSDEYELPERRNQ